MEIKEIVKLSEKCFGRIPAHIEKLAGAGSSRRYYRLLFDTSAGIGAGAVESVIATAGDDLTENRAFCKLAEVFGATLSGDKSYLVPKVYGHSDNYNVYLQQDMGQVSLLDRIMEDRKRCGIVGSELAGIIDGLFKALLRIQLTPRQRWIDKIYAAPFDERRILADLNYFKYYFLKVSGLCFDEERLNKEFYDLSHNVAAYDARLRGFMYRDFQSRNVMVDPEGRCGFIDFQGSMEGPVVYDAVSFLWQAKAGFPQHFRKEMLGRYVEMLSRERGIDTGTVMEVALQMVLLRTLQVLGAYGFRGLIEHKAHFVESIPPALENLAEVVETGIIDAYPEILRCCRELPKLDRFRQSTRAGLKVEVLSFSYKKGYPENLTGNGGGFVFDCRGMHNPGRYEEYKQLTGMDRPVVDFLEERGEVQEFMKHVCGLVVPTVTTYLRRGFTDLQVAFGCTGGQHRSVYCAEAMGKMLQAAFPDLAVRVVHREQGIIYDKD